MLQSICASIVQLSRRNSINSSMFEFVATILIACILVIIRLLGKCNLKHYLQHLHGFLWRVQRPAVITDDRLRKKKKSRKIICDRCKKTLVYKGQTVCHLGNFIHAHFEKSVHFLIFGQSLSLSLSNKGTALVVSLVVSPAKL